MRKSDVEFHSDGFRESRPAVNVKVYRSLWDVKLPINLGGSRPANQPNAPITWEYTDTRFTTDWVEQHVEESDVNAAWEMACEDGWEQLQMFAEKTFGTDVKVYSEGRSGGWAVVHNLPDFESWDAVMLAKWARFAKYARLVADHVPEQILVSLYLNEWEQAQEDAATVASGVAVG